MKRLWAWIRRQRLLDDELLPYPTDWKLDAREAPPWSEVDVQALQAASRLRPWWTRNAG